MNNLNFTEVSNHIAESFYNMSEVSKVLTAAWISKQHVLLYGPGGYGKSEVAAEFGKYLKDKGLIETDPFILSLNQGTTEDKLFGGLDIKKFNEKGEIDFLLEKSFANYEYVIFEEAFDAPIPVLNSLKDALTSGYIRNGSQVFQIKTRLIVLCTNRTREEVAEDDSAEALLQRFPLEYKVEWASHKKEDYLQMMLKRNVGDKMLAEDVACIVNEVNIAANADKAKVFRAISPRTAMKAYQVLFECHNSSKATENKKDGQEMEYDYSLLNFFYGDWQQGITKFNVIMAARKEDRKDLARIKQEFDKVETAVMDWKKLISSAKRVVLPKQVPYVLAAISAFYDILNITKVRDANSEIVKQMREKTWGEIYGLLNQNKPNNPMPNTAYNMWKDLASHKAVPQVSQIAIFKNLLSATTNEEEE